MAYNFGSPGWTPVVGDWNNNGITKIGVTNGQQWYLDTYGNGAWDAGSDMAYNFGSPGCNPPLWATGITTESRKSGSRMASNGIWIQPETVMGRGFRYGLQLRVARLDPRCGRLE